MGLLGICLSLAASSAAAPTFVPVERFTLAWTHSIEHVRWEEDYQVVAATTPGQAPRLQALHARVRGSAAGMEPPDDAVLRDGWYEYQPTTWSPEGLRLTRSVYSADYEWCAGGRCLPMGRLLPSDGGITLLRPCRDPSAP